ncbi:MAG: DUF72 domain-containing protein [Kiloniellales bacterium]|nr:DUF72 domain-containing protein [Kiloniellales bacterium]
MARHWIGTSGWSYRNWREGFYPKALKPGEWLGFYAGVLRCVELNASFYRLPREDQLKTWAARTPPDFRFAAKAWRAITHFRRLRDCGELLDAFFARLEALEDKLGPVLFQLPPRFGADPQRLDAFLGGLPRGRRVAVEFRDPSWHCTEVYAVLEAHGAAFCPFELAELRGPRVVTADFTYVRLHGRLARYRGCYGEAELADWAGWLRAQLALGRDVYVFFDNTDEADWAPRNAQRLDRLLAEAPPPKVNPAQP